MVLGPLRHVAQMEPSVAAALRTFDGATPARQAAWEAAYGAALAKARVQGTTVRLPAGGYGPVAPLMAGLLTLGRSGLLEPAVDNSPRIYSTDNTRSILFLQSAALPAQAARFHLVGSQWGMMNETGNYPGQAWLWLYTFWYQVPAYASSPNADVLVLSHDGRAHAGVVAAALDSGAQPAAAPPRRLPPDLARLLSRPGRARSASARARAWSACAGGQTR